MGDGWETARRRGPGNDWVILALGHAGEIEKVEVDTAHFKGNYPDRVTIEAAMFARDAEAVAESDTWLPPGCRCLLKPSWKWINSITSRVSLSPLVP